MEDSVVAAYLSLLLGCILQDNKVRINKITSRAYVLLIVRCHSNGHLWTILHLKISNSSL